MSIKLNSDFLAVVTGASRGNGKAIATAFETAGAIVVRVDIQECNSKNVCFIGDVSDQKLIDSVKKYCLKQKFKSFVLVNNAGITSPHSFPYPRDFWDKTISINLTAPFMWIETFIPLFKNVDEGSIINITSLAAERAFPDNPSYIASKGGLKMLTKYYAKSLGQYGIRANNVGPGYIVTDMTTKSYSDKLTRERREKHTLLGRWGDTKDVAGVCLFLASKESKYLTGQDLYIDGGWTTNGLVE